MLFSTSQQVTTIHEAPKKPSMSALERKRQLMNHGSARVPSWLSLSSSSSSSSSTWTGSKKTKSILHVKSLSSSSLLSECDSVDTSSQQTLPTVIDSLMGSRSSSSSSSSSSSTLLSTSQQQEQQRIETNETVEEIPDTVFLPLPSAGVSKMYRHKMMMEKSEEGGGGAELGDRLFGRPTSIVPNDAEMNHEEDEDNDEDDKVMMMQQSGRLAMEYRERLNQAQHQMDSLYVKLHKSKQLQHALTSRNMQLIHKLALISHQDNILNVEVHEGCKLSLVQKDSASKISSSNSSSSSSVVVVTAAHPDDAKSYVAMFLKCCMVLCLILLLSGEQAFCLAIVVFCWWLLETV